MRLILLIATLMTTNSLYAGNTNSQPQLDKVVASLNVDLDGDHYVDTAILAKPEKQAQEDLDLWIKLSSDNQYYKVEGLVIDMNGGMAGQGTELKTNSAGSLQVYSYNEAIGRSRWEETTTFAYRGGKVVLAGYTHNMRDTLDLSFLQCDINLLTRRGVVQSDRGDGTFQLNPSSILSLEEVNQNSVIDQYLDGGCVDATSDMDAGDL